MAQPLPDFNELSPERRIELAEALWESLGNDPASVPLTAGQKEELDRRVAAYRADRDPGSPWREVLDRIENRSR
ncbi:MAG: addiction module protein [Acidobacteria bacterium]|nr:addiction module protein [Acidobacteriota bacterium]